MIARTAIQTMGAAACSTVGALGSRVGDSNKKAVVVISGPSGCGKSTLLNMLFAAYPDRFGFSVSHTTRQPRAGEQDGVHYHFVDRAKMQELKKNGGFLETAEFGSNMYGTSKDAVKSVVSEQKICILDIEIQGVLSVKKLSSELSPMFVYIKPPSFEVLEHRLRDRLTEDQDSLAKRLSQAKKDMEYIKENPGIFDYTIINDNLETAYSELQAALKPFLE